MLDLSCRDWEKRIRAGRSLVPELKLNKAEGDRAVAIFNRLRLADVPGTPTMAEAAGEWFRDIVRALFGSINPRTRERAIRELFLLVPKKNSKALALDTLVATPTGFTTMRDVKVGDLVLDIQGRPTPVLCKSEVFTDRQCYEVEFSTGERVVCDAEHLWVTDAHSDRDKQPRAQRGQPMPTVKSTAEIAKRVVVKSGALRISNHRTALGGALELSEADLPIPPYVLGAWLGDGHSVAARITAGAQDVEHMVRQIRAAGHSARIAGRDKRSTAMLISIAEEAGNRKLPYRFSSVAAALGLIGNKHIPPRYLRASTEQRLRLLRGLMDTDGSISAAGQASFVTTLPALREGMRELVNSLGLKSSVSEHRARLGTKDCGPCWCIQFWPFDDVPAFTIQRKLARQRPAKSRNAQRSRTRQIVAVRPVDSVPTQCIGVASDSHQFLVTRSFIPTHNTTNGALLMLTALLLNERPHAPLIMTAPVQDVAEIAFEAAAGAIRLDPVLDKLLHIREHLKTIVHRETKAELQIMTFDPAVLTGQKVVGALIDELHVVAKMSKAPSAIRQLRGGMMPYPEAFLAFITTQSEEPPAGVFRAELAKARGIRDGRLKGTMLPVLYELPNNMQKSRDAWRDPKNWAMVTPNEGRSITVERLVEEMATAEETGQEELIAWASQHLNIEIGLALRSDGWAGAPFWESCGRDGLTLAQILERSDVVDVGIDGGGLDDLLGLTVAGRDRETREWLTWSHAWAHGSVLERRKSEAQRFRDFEKHGDMTIIETLGDDVDAAAAIVAQVEVAGLLDKVGIDPSGVGGILDALVLAGIPQEKVIGISQGWRLTGAIKTTERKVAEGMLVHAAQPMMAWCVGNAKVEPKGNAILITKQASGTAKIDPLMALFNAVSLMALNPAAAGKSFWEPA